MLVGTITEAWNQIQRLQSGVSSGSWTSNLPQVPQIPAPIAAKPPVSPYVYPKPTVSPPMATVTQTAPTYTGTVGVDVGLDWKTIALVVGGMAVVGGGLFFLLRKPRRGRRRRRR